ncbi:hypothetical protein [Pseudomonas sp. AM14(2022)]|uniref:hypothetical protein n=1 Tax=Pseudomonas sp. AM14(2022) TaxID=2983371 RepID=UPI002E80D222|nr:hypothetical protein [Pseudomonas sp. AM14(2022)]
MKTNLPVATLAGAECLRTATLDGDQMRSMNFAREEFDKLVQILAPLIDPAMCTEENGVASDIARHLEQIRIFSGNFCWRHRHLGSSGTARNIRSIQRVGS